MSRFRIYIVLFLLSILSGAAHAGLQGALDDALNDLSTATGGAVIGNATAPQIAETSSAGYISGGSLKLKSKIYDVNMVGFSSPYIKAGCGGLDMYGGSLSFINGSEFKELLRSIASNATGYAFQLALESMCSQCSNLMGSLQEKIQKLNEQMGNSCQMAQGLVNNTWDAKQNKVDMSASMRNVKDGVVDGFEAVFSRSAEGASPADQATGTPAEANLKKTLMGNMVWRALASSGSGVALSGEDDQLYRVMMSLTGTTIVKSTPSVAVTTGGTSNKELTTQPVAPLLSLDDLMTGNDVKIYKCDDGIGEDECLELSPQTISFDGMIQKLEEILIGSASSQGIVQKFMHNTGSMNASEQFLIANSGSELGVLVRNAAINNFGESFVSASLKPMALSYSYEIARDLLDGAILRVSSNAEKISNPEVILESMRSRKKELRDEYRNLQATYGKPTEIIGTYNQLKTISNKSTPVFYN